MSNGVAGGRIMGGQSAGTDAATGRLQVLLGNRNFVT